VGAGEGPGTLVTPGCDCPRGRCPCPCKAAVLCSSDLIGVFAGG
jgi:hypothetical protein